MENRVLIVTLALGLLALASGALIAMLAWRRAPDGFEDNNGFHRTPRTSASRRTHCAKSS
jgi:hypothetical protein